MQSKVRNNCIPVVTGKVFIVLPCSHMGANRLIPHQYRNGNGGGTFNLSRNTPLRTIKYTHWAQSWDGTAVHGPYKVPAVWWLVFWGRSERNQWNLQGEHGWKTTWLTAGAAWDIWPRSSKSQERGVLAPGQKEIDGDLQGRDRHWAVTADQEGRGLKGDQTEAPGHSSVSGLYLQWKL